MYFNFIKNNKIFFDNKYEKVLYLNDYVHRIDFSVYDKNQKNLEETIYNKKNYDFFNKSKYYNSGSEESIYLSAEDEKENSEYSTLTPDEFGEFSHFKFSPQQLDKSKEIEEEEDNEYNGLRSIRRRINGSFKKINKKYKRFESFDATYSSKTKLKSILKDSNSEELHKRKLNADSGKKVSFGKTVYFY